MVLPQAVPAVHILLHTTATAPFVTRVDGWPARYAVFDCTLVAGSRDLTRDQRAWQRREKRNSTTSCQPAAAVPGLGEMAVVTASAAQPIARGSLPLQAALRQRAIALAGCAPPSKTPDAAITEISSLIFVFIGIPCAEL